MKLFCSIRTGEESYLGFSISPLTDPEGSLIGHTLIFQDITRFKEMEEADEASGQDGGRRSSWPPGWPMRSETPGLSERVDSNVEKANSP